MNYTIIFRTVTILLNLKERYFWGYYKPEQDRSVYFVESTNEKWAEYKNEQAQKAKQREEKSKEFKWVTIGNTRVDDDYIDAHIKKGETRDKAKERLISELKRQLELDLDNDDVPEHVKFMREKTLRNERDS